MKIVIDTNVLISAAFFGGVPKEVIDLVTKKNVSAYMNEEILTEYNVTVSKVACKSKRHIDQNLFEEFIKSVNVIESVASVNVCRDSTDNKFIACAVDAKAIYVVSGDKDLLTVERYDDVEIITAKEFYERYLLSQS